MAERRRPCVGERPLGVRLRPREGTRPLCSQSKPDRPGVPVRRPGVLPIGDSSGARDREHAPASRYASRHGNDPRAGNGDRPLHSRRSRVRDRHPQLRDVDHRRRGERDRKS